MRADLAVLETFALLDALKLEGWTVRAVPFIPRDEEDERRNVDCHGLTCYSEKAIVLSKRYLSTQTEQECRALLAHECAHALLGASSNDHGTEFRAALDRVCAVPFA